LWANDVERKMAIELKASTFPPESVKVGLCTCAGLDSNNEGDTPRQRAICAFAPTPGLALRLVVELEFGDDVQPFGKSERTSSACRAWAFSCDVTLEPTAPAELASVPTKIPAANNPAATRCMAAECSRCRCQRRVTATEARCCSKPMENGSPLEVNVIW